MDANITLGILLLCILAGVVGMIVRATREPISAPAGPADGKTMLHCLAAGVLSLVFVGAGQFYNHQFGKAFLLFIAALIAWFVLLGWIIHLIAFVDAIIIAYRLRDNPWMRR